MKKRLLGLVIVLFVVVALFYGLRYLPRTIHKPMPKAAKVLVHKQARTLSLLDAQNRVIKSYTIGLGDAPVGHKQQEGDERTPEGDYVLDWRNARSRYHLSLHISYPNAEDRAHAQARGVSPGGAIMIHGLPNGLSAAADMFANRDWTDGCIAVNNEEIEEIWASVENGTPIRILP
ncbi:L,D-transpeptidase family protein [Magnetococcus sp. PR-3]|uniref:L,D-transpeptidase family protein n=1 Tax=Magnetococcus sp. PR-3 TaxID=3120355 RepID=UPI002FCE1D23